MAENIPQSIEVPVGLAIFGSRVTEMSPPDLPEGVSPDCQDVAFLPGTVKNRPCLHKLYPQLPDDVTITYLKTFVQPNGNPLTLVLDSLGNLWQEDVKNNPNNLTKIGTVTPGSYCSSVTADGREFMCFHNGVTGTDIPRQYDGTNLDRVSQDGCAGQATFNNVGINSQDSVTTLNGPTTVTSVTPVDPVVLQDGIEIFQFLQIVTASAHGLNVGDRFLTTGVSSAYNMNAALVASVINATTFTVAYNQTSGGIVTGGQVKKILGSCIVNGIGYFVSTTAIQLSVGFQVQVLGSLGAGAAIISIQIANGIATFTCNQQHGLNPQAVIQYYGPPPQTIANISAISRVSDVATVTTAANHNLQPGVPINIVGASDATFDAQAAIVIAVIDNTHFTYESIENDGTATAAGTVQAVWPLNPSTYFTIDTVPNSVQFTVPVSYPDSNWTGGTWVYISDGTYYVTSIINEFTFTVKVPNWCNTYFVLNTQANFSSILLTPFGQMAPGSRQMTVLFETRNGLVVGPSAPITVETSGGQYGYISNIPIGPPNTTSRILAFTGAGGSNFFYIPVPAQVNGVIVSTSTVINDNTTTDALLDFSDNTLFDGLGIDIPGNDLFESQVLSPCIGVSFYASRLCWWGLDNKIPNFVNMGFDGGFFSTTPANPCGWTVGSTGGSLVASVLTSGGQAWEIVGDGSANRKGLITQTAYEDWEGAPIVQPNTFYNFKLWVALAGRVGPGTVSATLTSASTGFTSIASVGVSSIHTAGFITVAFNNETPDNIPQDLILSVYAVGLSTGESVILDEMSLINTITPLVLPAQFSYADDLETYDGDTGHLGPTDDTTPIQCAFEHRDALNFLTSTGLHETQDNANSEPDGWGIRQVSSFCGAAGPRAMSMGENFAAWVSSPSVNPGPGLGLYVYTGGAVYKVSQEIQPDFDNINPLAQSSICMQNDPVNRRIYICLPVNGATAPNVIYPLDYRELDVASDLVNRPPVHISFTGKMICSDLSRKWTIWNVAANCIAIIARPGGTAECVIGGGTGVAPPGGSGFGNAYYFDDDKLTDDDYGQVNPYYVTYFFINHEMEQALQVGLHRKLYSRYAAYISGVGKLQLTPYADNLANPYPIPPMWTLNVTQLYDIGDGLNVDASRCAFKIASIPFSGTTDNAFNLQKLIITLKQHPISPIRFGAI